MHVNGQCLWQGLSLSSEKQEGQVLRSNHGDRSDGWVGWKGEEIGRWAGAGQPMSPWR